MYEERKLLGHAPVDSGQIIVIDPCYLNDWVGGDVVDNPNSDGRMETAFILENQTNDYGRTCAVTIAKAEGGEVHGGVAVGSFGGDGNFPVYGYFRDGLLRRLEVVFEYDEEEEEEEAEVVCEHCGNWTDPYDIDGDGLCPQCHEEEEIEDEEDEDA